MKLASRGKRLGAGLIDMIVTFIAYMFLISIYGIEAVLPGGGYGFGSSYGYGYGLDYGNNYNLPTSSGSIALTFVLLIVLIAYIVAELVLYARAQSIGKAILGLQVVSTKDGKPFGFWKMMLREIIVKSASSSVFMLGFIWILLDDKNRSWHDKILDSYVVDLKETAIMYQRAQMQQMAQRQEESVSKQEPKAEMHEIKDPDLEATANIKLPEQVEKLEEPEKVEALEAPEKVEALDAPITTEESITAAGDEQTELSEKEDDAEII